MKNRTGVFAAIAGLVLACFTHSAFAGDVTVSYTGSYSSTALGYGAGLYSGTVNGQSTNIICDDFADHITNGEVWSATELYASSLNASNIGDTLFGNHVTIDGNVEGGIGLDGYAEVAYLVNEMLGTSNTTMQGELSAAIWYITTNNSSVLPIGDLNSEEQSLVSTVQGLYGADTTTQAVGALAAYTNLAILTPSPEGPDEAQEMWIVTPEGGAAMTYLLLAGATCFGAAFFRSRDRLGCRASA